jgi:uncharacterized membrane protein YedE/YeeE
VIYPTPRAAASTRRVGYKISMSTTILFPLLGGLVIGASAVLLLALSGRMAGVSSIVGGLVSPATPSGDRAWRLAFVAGLALGGMVLLRWFPATLPDGLPASAPVVVLAGLLVGLGAGMASGCTSGHGVCGLGRRSPRSLAAVLVFMSTGVLAAQLLRPLLGVAP